jgi:hypothetical protein
MNPSTPESSSAINWGRYALVGLATIVAAVAANVLVYVIGRAVIPVDPRFIVLTTVQPTIIFTIVPAIVAVLLYALLLRLTTNPERIFTWIAAVVLVLSIVPDLTYIPTVPGATAGQTALLVVMHVVAAVVIVAMLTGLARARQQ